jgi:hypothetical protein
LAGGGSAGLEGSGTSAAESARFFLLSLRWRGRRFPTPLGGREAERARAVGGGPQKTLQKFAQERGKSRNAKKTAPEAGKVSGRVRPRNPRRGDQGGLGTGRLLAEKASTESGTLILREVKLVGVGREEGVFKESRVDETSVVHLSAH